MTMEKIAKTCMENGIDYEIKYHKFERVTNPAQEEENIEGLVLTIKETFFQGFSFSDLISFSTTEYECYYEVTEKEEKEFDEVQKEYSDFLWTVRLADVYFSYYGEKLYKVGENAFIRFC